jgi:hypothetical protein
VLLYDEVSCFIKWFVSPAPILLVIRLLYLLEYIILLLSFCMIAEQ